MKAGRVATESDGVRHAKVAERETEANERRIRTWRAKRGRGITHQPLGSFNTGRKPGHLPMCLPWRNRMEKGRIIREGQLGQAFLERERWCTDGLFLSKGRKNYKATGQVRVGIKQQRGTSLSETWGRGK